MHSRRQVKYSLDELSGLARPVIERVMPEIGSGDYPIKRVVGEHVRVEAIVICDGHDEIGCSLLYRHESEKEWSETVLEPKGENRLVSNDWWAGKFPVDRVGFYYYTVQSWVDGFRSWSAAFQKKAEAGQELFVELQMGLQLVEGRRASGSKKWAKAVEGSLDLLKKALSSKSSQEMVAAACNPDLVSLMASLPNKSVAARYPRELEVLVERKKAGFSTWYEVFPRSLGKRGRHGTFRDCIDFLPYVADMGFDVLYLPPIHPIGTSHRKGKNNSLKAKTGDPGVPWAIGSKEGGHKAVHPELGTLEDFRKLVKAAQDRGLEIALDLAYQCSPDHPYVKEHPEWFSIRPDGTVQYAENPPKKYEDIVPFNFETPDWKVLWTELKSIVTFWMEQGVRIFRVDNPHTKSFRFWTWLLREIRQQDPEVIFLSEAFTRQHVMAHLARIGFSQSYSYFTWRYGKGDLKDYLTELTQTELSEYFRPNFWPNTPDILMDYLQRDGRPAFISRLILAATMSSNYGIYGPAFELCENTPREVGKEEYLNSEKYEIRTWDRKQSASLRPLIQKVNYIRHENRALQQNQIRFHWVDNERLICYSKHTDDPTEAIIVIVSLDSVYKQSGFVELNLVDFGLASGQKFRVKDLLSEATYMWQGQRNYVELVPESRPAHIFKLEGA